jgi:osmotically-inducible protein OsmY
VLLDLIRLIRIQEGSPVPKMGEALRAAVLTVGCAVAVLFAACVPTDSDIRADVRARLTASPVTTGLRLSIDVNDGVVRLSGKTVTREEQQRAMVLARSVNGVKVVVSDMWSTNLALVKKVEEALAADPMVAMIPIEVDARGNTVYLISAQTNQEQRTRAVQATSAVPGVGHVEDLMK